MSHDEPACTESEVLGEALESLIKAWRARDWIEKHIAGLLGPSPCVTCIEMARAVLRGQINVTDLMCPDGREARARIKTATDLVKKTTGDVIS